MYKPLIVFFLLSFSLSWSQKDTLTEENRLKWTGINTHLVMGKKDELINENMKAKFLKLVTDYKLDYKLTLYDGDHRVYTDVLKELVKNFD